ncbi:MAG: flagellar filament capping protein FliD [Synergistaceae bacterium]|nr:flagellar filament capping protein FliD [Synergistaceae bacterium]
MASMSINGVVSGMDWESMIDEIITAAAKPAQVQVNKKTNLQNKKSLFEEMKVMMNSLQSSLTTLKLPSTYTAKEIEIENLDGGSYKKILTATVNADAEVSVHDINVKQIATAQTVRSRQMTGSTISSYVGGKDKVMTITAGGQTIDVDVKASDSLQSLKSRINNVIKSLDNPMNLTASVVDNKLVLKSDSTGLGQTKIEGTVRGGYSSSGVTSLKGLITNADSGATADISVTKDNYDNLKISSGSTTYTRGTDYVIVNNNEIRWKQYEDTDNEIKLGKSINSMKYTMNSNDVYTVTGTQGTSEADLSALNIIDNGTLSSRVKIKDDNGVEYTYGQDFTIEDGKVVWLDAPAETKEPDTYTVNYSKTEALTSTISGTKASSTGGPASFTVNYTKTIANENFTDTLNYNNATTIPGLGMSTFEGYDGVEIVTSNASGRDVRYVKFDDPSEVSLTFTPSDGGDATSYTYGPQVVLRESGSATSETAYLVWSRDSVYTNIQGGSVTSTAMPTAGSNQSSAGTYTFTYKHKYTSQNGVSQEVLNAAGSDLTNISITDASGKTYTNGTDFTISSDGTINWATSAPSADDEISDTKFDDFAANYREYYSLDDDADLPTITLTDGEGVMRTYIDPADTSLFTMTNTTTGETYEYGKDYVIRVNDNGDGYVFSWAISSDKNGDGYRNILDANASVIAYAREKGFTTYGMKASPTSAEEYNFTFSGEVTKTDSGTVNKTDADDDKTLANVLKNVTVDSEDYDDDTILSITDGTTTYVMGTDYKIDSSGKIVWLNQSDEAPTSYTATYSNPSITVTGSNANARSYNLTTAQNGFPKYTDFQALYKATKGTDVPTVTASGLVYIADEDFFSVEGYEYGKDFVVIRGGGGLVSTIGDYSLVIAWAPDGIVRNYPNQTMSDITSHSNPYTVSMQSIISDEISTDSTEKLTDILGLTSLSDMSKVVITAGGNIYQYNSTATTVNDLAEDEYFLDDGVVKLGVPDYTTPKRPTGSYTLTYEAFDDLTASDTYAGASQQDIAITVDSGYGDIGGNQLSYEQILENTGLSSSSSNANFAKYFSLVDEDGNTYTYGTDYKIIQGSTYGTTSSHYAAVSWLDDGTTPTTGKTFTLTYTGSETMELTDAITRSAQDTITSTSTVMPTYGTFISADAIRITDGKNNYYLGQDFTIDIDAYTYRNGSVVLDENNNFVGNAVIKWNTATVGEPNFRTRFEDASSVIITASDGTTYSLENEDFDVFSYGDGYAIINWADDVTPDSSLTYTVTAVKDGITKTYDLNSDLQRMTQRAAWFEDEHSDSYDIIVTTNDNTNITFTGNYNNDELEILPTGLPDISDFDDGTVTITQGTKTFYDGVDFTIEEDDDGNAVVQWITDSEGGYEWYYPNSGINSTYTINLTSSDGTVKTYLATRNYKETLDMSDYGFTSYNGNISVKTTDEDGNEVYVDASTTEVARDASGNIIYQQERKSRQVPDLDEDGDYQFDLSGNILYKTEYYYENKLDENGNPIPVMVSSGNNALADAYSFNVTTGKTGGENTLFNFNWLTPSRTSRTGLPAYGDELNINYEYDANTFSLSGTDDVLDDLGLDESYWYNSDGTENNAYYTGAHNAIFDLDGAEIERDTNDIGESYGNEVANLKGVTLHLKGPGSVSLDIFHDAEKAVESINTFKDNYNDLMSWMNTRMTESQVDEDTAATVDSDDFRMRWGLLHGNSLLRNTKSQMRSITSQNFTFSFNERKSSQEIYGTMANNGLRSDATLRLRIGSTYSDLTISPYYTLQQIVDMINDSTNPAMRNMYYDEEGKLRDQPLLKASIVDDKLVINSTSNDTITVSGSAALNALKMNYTYKGVYQLGLGVNASAELGSSSTVDFTKVESGELEFNESKFMEALEDNPDEVQELMRMFANQMDSWCKSMLSSATEGNAKGTLTRQIDDIDTQIQSIDEYLEKYQDRLDRQEESLRSKFSAAESQIAKLSQQANSIASILNMLNGNNSGSSNYTAQT